MTAARVRDRLVDALRATGRVRTPAVEEAFRAVPRHLFLPDVPVREAYADEAVAVRHIDGVATSTASQPSMMAIMLEQLDVRPGQHVLEIGAGTGYNAALLAHLVGDTGGVTAVDIDAELVDRAAAHLTSAGVAGVELRCGDGALGHPAGAPYDRIVLTVGCPEVRPEWVRQLAPGGRLLLPLTLRGSQVSAALDLGPDGVLRSSSVRGCAFVRLQGVAAAPEVAVPLRGGALLGRPAADEPDAVTVDATARLDAALAQPGHPTPLPVSLGAADLWDGFGLYLALTTPGTWRLLLADPDDGSDTSALPRPMAPGLGTLALAGGAGTAVVTGGPTGLRAHGPDGAAQAERLRGAVDAWVAAGRPRAAGLRVTVRPRTPGDRPSPGPGTVRTPHCLIAAGWCNDAGAAGV